MPQAESPPLRFEQALAELETILRELEDGTTSLEDALARYERGVGLLRQCYAQLRDAEQKVKLLAGLTEDGSANAGGLTSRVFATGSPPGFGGPFPKNRSLRSMSYPDLGEPGASATG